jgi:hypothetical protein
MTCLCSATFRANLDFYPTYDNMSLFIKYDFYQKYFLHASNIIKLQAIST